YLGILGTLWTSAISVADLLQVDDLFQLGQPMSLPPLPNLEPPAWPCHHGAPMGGAASCNVVSSNIQIVPTGSTVPPPAAMGYGPAPVAAQQTVQRMPQQQITIREMPSQQAVPPGFVLQ